MNSVNRIARSALLFGISVVSLRSTEATAQVRSLERSRLPRGIDSALRIGTLRVVDSTRVTVVRPTISNIQLRNGQFVAARTGESTRIVRRPATLGMARRPGANTIDTLVVLPFSYVGVAEGNRLVHLQPVIIRDSPFRYDQDSGLFRGSLLVGLQDSLAPGIRKQIGEATPLTLVSEGNNVVPRELQIGYTNYPLERVVVTARDPSDSVSVRVIPSFDARGSVVWMSVRPTLVFEAPPKKAAGLGIHTVSFPVRVVGASVSDSITVTLAVDEGSLKEARVKIGPSASATVYLRSQGIGGGRVTATSPRMDPATVTIDYRWPFWFLAFALIGGAVGGLIKHVVRSRARMTGVLRPMLIGTLIGFLISVAYYAVDVNLLRFAVTIPFFDEAAVFAIAMLGAFFGVRKLKATNA